jgi:hypothetical protein
VSALREGDLVTDTFFGSVKKVFKAFSSTDGEDQLLIPGQDFPYVITEIILRTDGLPADGVISLFKDSGKLLDINIPASLEPIYVDGDRWMVGHQESVSLQLAVGYVISGRLMIEIVTDR